LRDSVASRNIVKTTLYFCESYEIIIIVINILNGNKRLRKRIIIIIIIIIIICLSNVKLLPLARSDRAFFSCFLPSVEAFYFRMGFFLYDPTTNGCFVGFSSSASTEERRLAYECCALRSPYTMPASLSSVGKLRQPNVCESLFYVIIL